MLPFRAIIGTLFVFGTSVCLSVVCFFLSPFSWAKQAFLVKRHPELTRRAVEELNCGALSKKVRLDSGIQLHVVEAGNPNGKLIILLHGFPENWHSWHHVIPTLCKQKDYLVVAPDMRGYNLSDKPAGVHNYTMEILVNDVLSLMKYYKREKVHAIVCHDWGGAIGWSFAMKYPEHLEKLAALNAPHPLAYRREAATNWSQRLSSWYMIFFQIPLLPKYLFLSDPLKTFKRAIETKSRKPSDAELEYLAAAVSLPNSIDCMLNYYKAMLRGIVKQIIFKKAKAEASNHIVKCPTLVLWGEDDTALVKGVARVEKWVPDLTLQYVPNCSHWIQYDVPDVVNRHLLEFLKKK